MTAQKKKTEDPFEGMHIMGMIGLPLARYAYDFAGKESESEKKKDKIYI